MVACRTFDFVCKHDICSNESTANSYHYCNSEVALSSVGRPNLIRVDQGKNVQAEVLS